MDTVTAYHRAQAKHTRQLNRLSKKILAKWKTEDFEAFAATRRERDAAVAALTSEQVAKHAPEFRHLTKAQS